MSKTVFEMENDNSLIEINQSGIFWWKSFRYLVISGYEVRTGTRSTYEGALASSLAALKVLESES